MLTTKLNDFYTILGTGSTFSLDIKGCTRQPKTFHEELLWNAEYLYNNKVGKINICYSGGIDSEYILELFLSMGMEVNVVVLKYENDLNYHDIKYALDYCEHKKIKPIIIDVNFENFVKSGKIVDVASTVNCVVWQYPIMMDAFSKLDGTVLLGSDEPHFHKNKETNDWHFDEMERIMAVWDRWYKFNNIPGTPCLLSYSPETILAYMNDPLVIDLFDNKVPGKEGTNSSKNIIYNRIFNSIHPRTKYTGFEKIAELPIFEHPNILKVKTKVSDFHLPGNGVYVIEHSELRNILENNDKQ